MLLINLIAARRAERRKLELIRGGIARGMVAVGVATVLTAASMEYSIQTTRNRIQDVEQQTAMLQSTVSMVEELQTAMAAIQPRVATLLKAQNATNRWRAVLQEVSASLPEKAWLTSFTSQAQPAEGFTITGQTVSQALVGRTMMQIQKQPYMKSVELHYTQSNGQSSGPAGGSASAQPRTVNFEMAGALEPVEGVSDGK